MNSILTVGEKIFTVDEKEFVVSYLEGRFKDVMPGANTRRIFDIFQKDKKLVSLSDLVKQYTRKKQSLTLNELCQFYAEYICNLYRKEPEKFFRLEEWLERYLTERLRFFGFTVINQHRGKSNGFGYGTVDIFYQIKVILLSLNQAHTREIHSLMCCKQEDTKRFSMPLAC